MEEVADLDLDHVDFTHFAWNQRAHAPRPRPPKPFLFGLAALAVAWTLASCGAVQDPRQGCVEVSTRNDAGEWECACCEALEARKFEMAGESFGQDVSALGLAVGNNEYGPSEFVGAVESADYEIWMRQDANDNHGSTE